MRSDALGSSDTAPRNPITGIPGCCARAASGQAAAPPSAAMNSRRLMNSPQAKGGHTTISLDAAVLCITAKFGGQCLIWVIRVVAGQSRP